MSAGLSRPFTLGSGGTSGRQRVIVCYNCKGEGRMAKQCTKPKRKRDAEWFKDKVLLGQAQASGQVLQEEELDFLADPGMAESSTNQTVITTMLLIKRMTWMLMIQTVMNSTLQRELALEKQVKELNNIVFKRSQSAQTVHMLTKPQVFYNHSTRQALEAIVVPNTEETLLLTEESHSKMIEKQNDPQMTEKKVVTKPINYDILNKLSTDFEKRFVTQTEPSEEQAFWSQYSVQTDEPNLSGTTTVEVPKELPKVSMVTTSTAITEGTWGFEHTKACFRDDIIPFVKSLKELFTSFDQCLIDEVTEVQNVFTQMELAVEQHCEEKSKVQINMENVLQENDRILTQALGVEIVNIVVHDNVKFVCLNVNACACCVTTESELKLDFLKKDYYETLLQKYQTLEKHCITLEINNQLNTKNFQKDTLSSNVSAPTFAELFKINDLKAQAQAKDTVILKLKEKLNSLNGDVRDRDVIRNVKESETLNIELGHQAIKLATENNHLKQTYKQLYDSIKSSRVRSKEQCDDLIKKVNIKSVEVSDLNARLQEKVLVITDLKE
nr:hypothetical protein [Tanacetum cinerariifolium]